MDSVLIVSSTDKGRELLAELLKPEEFSRTETAASSGEARRMLAETSFDLVLINTPLIDEFGHDLALTITEDPSIAVILIVKSELADDVSAKVEDYGVFVVPKPVGRQMFYQALKLVAAARRRILGLKKENVKLQNKIDEIRLVDRAKCSLIEYLNMTEKQAHRYIEKQAMDMRRTRKEVAESILKTYET